MTTPITDPSWAERAAAGVQIAASQQGGTRGAQLWGIDTNLAVKTTAQTSPGGDWTGWSP